MGPLLIPDLSQEFALYASGHVHVAGLDEAGRGAWAGPVCAAAVVLPLEEEGLAGSLEGVRDSKTLTPARREELLPIIRDVAVAVGVGWGEPGEIDLWGIVPTTRLAMERAVQGLGDYVSALVIDHLELPGLELPQRSLPKADGRCLSVAAASIVAKVERDTLMVDLDDEYPGYGLAQHKGYGTRQHREALQGLGCSPIHRVSWRPMRLASE
mgnify:CR=1 FL=1